MAANDVRKASSLFVNGKGYAGQVEELNPPKLTAKTEEFRAGGMNAPVDLHLGTEKMMTDFTLVAYDADVLALFGVIPGPVAIPFVIREALQSMDGTVTPVAHTMLGRVTEMDPGTSKSGDKPSLKISVSLTYYRLEHGGRVLQEIDPVNMVHIVNGVDMLAEQRAALAI